MDEPKGRDLMDRQERIDRHPNKNCTEQEDKANRDGQAKEHTQHDRQYRMRSTDDGTRKSTTGQTSSTGGNARRNSTTEHTHRQIPERQNHRQAGDSRQVRSGQDLGGRRETSKKQQLGQNRGNIEKNATEPTTEGGGDSGEDLGPGVDLVGVA